MSANKTTENSNSVEKFIDQVKDENKRKDCKQLIKLIKDQTGYEPKMWGTAIVGFGSHHYKYESGREGDSPNVSFSPRASSIALYLSGNFENREKLLKTFGKHKTNKGCIHIKSLDDIDEKVLAEMIDAHIKHVKSLYPEQN